MSIDFVKNADWNHYHRPVLLRIAREKMLDFSKMEMRMNPENPAVTDQKNESGLVDSIFNINTLILSTITKRNFVDSMKRSLSYESRNFQPCNLPLSQWT